MGNATNLIILMCSIYLVCGMVAISIADVDPTSPYLFGNHVFSPGNNYIVQSGSTQGTITYSGANSIIYTKNDSANGIENLSSGSVVGGNSGSVGATLGFLFPDWIRAGWTWITTTGKMFTNVIGAPYGLISGTISDPTLASLLEAFFGMITLFIIMNWILGRDT